MQIFESKINSEPKRGKKCPHCNKMVGCRSNTCIYCGRLIPRKGVKSDDGRPERKHTGNRPKNKALSEDTKRGEKDEFGIYNDMKEDNINAYRLSPSGKGSNKKRKDELAALYHNLFDCEVKRGSGNGFKISILMPKTLWYFICDLHREYTLGERIPNTQEELDAMKQVIENDKTPPEEWTKVPIVGIDLYGENDYYLIIIESKTDRPNAGIQHDMKLNLLKYQALLVLKNYREGKSRSRTPRKIVTAVAKKTNKLPPGLFPKDQVASFDDVRRLWRA